MKTLELQSLTRSFRDVKALDKFSLSVNQGELVSLLGPSGCGKTTALRIIAGLDHQDSGTVTIDGRNISEVPTHKRNMGMVFQQYSLFPNLNAEENIVFGLTMRNATKIQKRTRASELLDLVGLSDLGGRYPHQLSGGQQQRVALARAIAFEPEILLLDEPLAALDAQVRYQVREEIRRIQKVYGITTIFVTHDQEEAMSISDRVAVMNQGQLEQIDVPQKLYEFPSNPTVARFIGSMNEIPSSIEGQKVKVLGSLKSIAAESEFKENGDIVALVRPEAISLSNSSLEGVPGVLTNISFLGPISHLYINLDDGTEIKVSQSSHQVPRDIKDGKIFLSINSDSVMVANA
ncbi:MAG: ABC transporter ATP-binding protein [Burkholderiaceae bacterium]|nr:ABC transporter ATP-binding protein [Burkholderiaceae bacterium]